MKVGGSDAVPSQDWPLMSDAWPPDATLAGTACLVPVSGAPAGLNSTKAFPPWRHAKRNRVIRATQSMNLERIIGGRELSGNRIKLKEENFIVSRIRAHVKFCSFWSPSSSSVARKTILPGSIFNLEYSIDGQLLVAVGEERSILVFDSSTHKKILFNKESHADCVNFIRFIDDRTFATCSDDSTVKLWDMRNITASMRTFRGHSDWVKNIDYCKSKKLLITSGFDGHVLAWDINQYSETEECYSKILFMEGLMRSSLSKDGNVLALSSVSGYINVISNLNMKTVGAKMDGSNLLLQREEAETVNDNCQENQISKISQFYHNSFGATNVITSLLIHPENLCVLSRYRTVDESTEWTCSHNLMQLASLDTENPAALHPLSHFIEEPNIAIGIIKEFSFSQDGRLITSPFGYGFRILAFDAECNKFCNSYINPESTLFHETSYFWHNKSPVLVSKFSPQDFSIASGCIDGTVHFHRPIL